MTKLKKWFTSYAPWRELALFVIAVISIVISVTTYVRNERNREIQDRIAIERELDEAVDLLGSSVLELVVTGGREPEKVHRAHRLVRDVFAKDPQNLRAYFISGMVGIALRDPKYAAENFDKVYELAPDQPDAFVGMGMYAQAFGLKSEAVAMFRTALKKEPDSEEIRANLAGALMDAGERAEAQSVFEQLVKESPTNCQIRVLLGGLLSDAGMPNDGLHHLQMATTLCPSSQVAQMNLGHVLVKLKRLDEALESYETASALHPDYSGAHFSVAEVLLQLGRRDLARDRYERAIKENPHDAWARLRLGQLQADDRDFAGAINTYKRALSDNGEYLQESPIDPSFLFALMSQSAANAAQFDEAIGYADEAIAANDTSIDAYRMKIFALEETGRHEEAARVMQEIARIQGGARQAPSD